MRWYSHFGVVLLVGFASGCLGTPKLKVDYRGAAALVGQPVAAARYPTATDLPERGDGCSGEFESYWCEGGAEAPTYRLGVGDRITVTVWGNPDLGSQPGSADGPGVSEIGNDGAIFLPFLGRVIVAGRTAQEVASSAKPLYTAVIDDPQIDVSLVECSSQFASIGGAVEKPASFALCQDRMTVRQLVEAAGGFAPDADPARALLVRDETPFSLSYDAVLQGGSNAGEVLVEPGDTLYFPASGERSAYVFGEVRDQGLYPIPTEGLTLLGLLGKAKGYDTDVAGTHNMYFVRQGNGQAQVYKFELSEVLESPDIYLTDGDRLFVPPSGMAKWARFWRSLFPFAVANRVR